MHVYVTGRHDGYKMQYACFAVTKNGATACNYGDLLGSKPETELQVVLIALKYAYASKAEWNPRMPQLSNQQDVGCQKQQEDAIVHTDFTNVQKRISGRIKATSQSAKDFAAFASMAREKINIQIIEELPDRERKVLDYILDNLRVAKPRDGWQWCEVSWSLPTFRVVVRDRNGNVLCDLNEKHFGGVLADAVQFANWYERESKKETSDYFGVTVERYNVPLTRETLIKTQ